MALFSANATVSQLEPCHCQAAIRCCHREQGFNQLGSCRGSWATGYSSQTLPHHCKSLLAEPAGPSPEEQGGGPGCLEVINYTIWQRNTTRFIAESATDGPESKTRITAEMSKCWPRTVGDGVCTCVCVCVCVCVHAGTERICGWGLRLCHFFRDYHKADTHSPPPPPWNIF